MTASARRDRILTDEVLQGGSGRPASTTMRPDDDEGGRLDASRARRGSVVLGAAAWERVRVRGGVRLD